MHPLLKAISKAAQFSVTLSKWFVERAAYDAKAMSCLFRLDAEILIRQSRHLKPLIRKSQAVKPQVLARREAEKTVPKPYSLSSTFYKP